MRGLDQVHSRFHVVRSPRSPGSSSQTGSWPSTSDTMLYTYPSQDAARAGQGRWLLRMHIKRPTSGFDDATTR
jgi:hypothetical protein